MIERRDLEMKKFKEIEHEEAGELGNASSEPLPYVIVSGTPVQSSYTIFFTITFHALFRIALER
mgnify:CR=1 FL=1